MATRTEEVYFLYGSQTGNSEQAAKDLSEQVKVRLSPATIQKLTGTNDKITVVPSHMQLDDFLELERAKWTRLIVIVVSSYGVGQAPLGGYRFRDLCDAWLEEEKSQKLDGVHFALCGLGDSKFTTFFRNPTKINDALHHVGAKRVGPLGKADASGKGADAQNLVIDRWVDEIWPFLASVAAKDPLSLEVLQQIQQHTVELCRKINPDFLPTPTSSQPTTLLVSLTVGLLAVVFGYYYLHRN